MRTEKDNVRSRREFYWRVDNPLLSLGMDFIGPSKCDDARKSRDHDIETVWNDLINTEGFAETYALFGPTIDLFREAQSCYQNGAYMATALMCRAVIEIGIYHLVSRQVSRYSPEDKTILEIKKSLEIVDQWRTILTVAKAKCNINENLELAINEIRDAGNFAAHYGQKLDKRDFKRLDEEESWFTRDKALEILKKTILVVNHLLKYTYERLPILSISIKGYEPKTYGSNDVERKKELRDLILSKINNLPEIQRKCRGKQLSLYVCFNLFEGTDVEGRKTKDLDNMLKIFCDVFPDFVDRDKKVKGLGLIEGDRDDMFFQIHCKKRLVKVESDEGIDFSIHEYLDRT